MFLQVLDGTASAHAERWKSDNLLGNGKFNCYRYLNCFLTVFSKIMLKRSAETHCHKKKWKTGTLSLLIAFLPWLDANYQRRKYSRRIQIARYDTCYIWYIIELVTLLNYVQCGFVYLQNSTASTINRALQCNEVITWQLNASDSWISAFSFCWTGLYSFGQLTSGLVIDSNVSCLDGFESLSQRVHKCIRTKGSVIINLLFRSQL